MFGNSKPTFFYMAYYSRSVDGENVTKLRKKVAYSNITYIVHNIGSARNKFLFISMLLLFHFQQDRNLPT